MNVPRPLSGVVIAAALLAAACGSEPASLDAGDATIAAAAQAEAPESEAAGPEPATESSVQEEPAEPASEEEGPAVPSNHLFPDLNTVNIADGSTLNLATELAGGDTPVLLWFFAPH